MGEVLFFGVFSLFFFTLLTGLFALIWQTVFSQKAKNTSALLRFRREMNYQRQQLRQSEEKQLLLWQKLESFSLDSCAKQGSIRHKLQAKLGLNDEAAEKLIHDYKEYMWLLSIGRSPAPPSAALLELWALHVAEDTEAYLGSFCSLLGFLPCLDKMVGNDDEDQEIPNAC